MTEEQNKDGSRMNYCTVTLRNGDGDILGQMWIPATDDMRNLSADWEFVEMGNKRTEIAEPVICPECGNHTISGGLMPMVHSEWVEFTDWMAKQQP